MGSKMTIAAELRSLGIQGGDVLMVHASLKRIGPVVGGARAVVGALCDAVAPSGTLMGYASWDHSPYGETLNGAQLDEETRRNWPPFRPDSARVYPGFGLLNQFFLDTPGALRSAHPDASMVALGPLAHELIEPHRLGQAFGLGSPLERFVERGGKVLLFGAPLDSVTVLHYAEAVADIPGKRRVTYEMPLLGIDGETVWEQAEDFDSNGIVDCFDFDGEMDAIETVARAYVALRRHREGRVANAHCYLFDAQDIVSFGVSYLEQRFARRAGTPVEGS
jgi:aminoglycoside N3'-acetyltransferase